MKTSYILFLLAFLFSCGSEKATVADTETAIPLQSAAVHQQDTVFSTVYVDTTSQQVSENFNYGQESYQVDVIAYSMGDSSLIDITKDTTVMPHKVLVSKYHNNAYEIKVRKNGNLLYSRQLTKLDFMGMGDDYFAKITYPLAPNPVGITANGYAVFDLSLIPDDSDYGSLAFFVLDENGKLVKKEVYGSTGGSGCSSFELSDDRKKILSCRTVYQIDGPNFEFGKDYMVATGFLTDSTFYSITDIVTLSEIRTRNEIYNGKVHTLRYLYEERDNVSDNLVVYHISGKKLTSYRYDGFTNELDYSVPVAHVKSIERLVLLDEEKKHLFTLNSSQPSESKIILFSTMVNIGNEVPANFTASTELHGSAGKYIFYFTDNNIIKYSIKPYTI